MATNYNVEVSKAVKPLRDAVAAIDAKLQDAQSRRAVAMMRSCTKQAFIDALSGQIDLQASKYEKKFKDYAGYIMRSRKTPMTAEAAQIIFNELRTYDELSPSALCYLFADQAKQKIQDLVNSINDPDPGIDNATYYQDLAVIDAEIDSLKKSRQALVDEWRSIAVSPL